MPGPIGGYCFHYTMKGTQNDDTEPYAKVKACMEKILSEMKYQENDNQEAARRILYASFCHQADNSIRPTMGAYLLRNKSRFIFSHDIIWCPLIDLKLLTDGEDITVRISFYKQSPFFQCIAMHYLCRPQSLENLNPFEFYSEYEVVQYSKTAIAVRNGSRLIRTPYFRHPSYDETQKVCDQVVVKRYNKVLLQIFQYTFSDAANFERNILTDELPVSDEVERYSHMVLLLFCPYRSANDLKLNGSYNERLRHLVNSHQLCKMHCDVLQNIQNCKSNDFRFTITNDDLARATEPFHTPISGNELSENNEMLELAEVTSDYDPMDDFDIADLLLTTDTEGLLDDFDMANTEDLDFNMDLIRRKSGVRCGYECLPILSGQEAENELYLQQNNFIQMSRQPNESIRTQPAELQIVTMNVQKMFVTMDINDDYRLNLNEIIGSNENVTVVPANGKAESIIDWAIKCKLDERQKQAFEIITGYYILSYIYSITDFQNYHYNSDYVKRERDKLELLVGKKIRNAQLVCFLHGPGGSGKSTVIALIQCYSRAYHRLIQSETYNRSIVVTAMTGVAATIIGGETAHSAIHLNTKLSKIGPEKIELWSNTKLLIIDEISFASDKIINLINRRLSRLKDNINPFGGIHIIFCGDLRQLEPVAGKPLYYKHDEIASVFKTHINCYIELDGMHRFHLDENWGQILLRFRNGFPTKEDIQYINKKVEVVETGIVNNIPFDVKYATFTNRDRDSINIGIFQEKLDYCHNKFNHTNNFIMIFSDDLNVKKDKNYIPVLKKKYFYENFGEGDIYPERSGRIDPVLKIYIGCDVILTENIDVVNGLANGTRATVESVFLNAGSNYKTIKLECGKIVRAVYASDVDYILLKHKDQKVENQMFQVKSKIVTFKASLAKQTANLSFETFLKDNKLLMKAKQFPIIVNNATTGHKLQGVGVDKLFVHAWHYKRNWPYVVLSRVKQFAGLFLRTPLDTNVRRYKMPKDLDSMIIFFQRYQPDNIDRNALIHSLELR
jgi:PIF1-like helicase